MTARALSWDYREQPDLEDLAEILAEVSGGRIHLHQVDTGGDQYGIVVADRELTAAEVDETWQGDR